MTFLRRVRWTATLAYWASLFVLTHKPSAPPKERGINDKLLDALAFGAGSFLLGLTLWASSRIDRSAATVPAWVLILVALYGAADELTQPIVGRVADPGDWLADVGGAAVAAAFLFVLRRLTRPRESGQT